MKACTVAGRGEGGSACHICDPTNRPVDLRYESEGGGEGGRKTPNGMAKHNGRPHD